MSTSRREIEIYHTNDQGEWLIRNYQEGDTITLESINLSFPIEQLYRGLVLDPEEAARPVT